MQCAELHDVTVARRSLRQGNAKGITRLDPILSHGTNAGTKAVNTQDRSPGEAKRLKAERDAELKAKRAKMKLCPF